jgi:hydrophobe/amphiphile efflux-3 (HAE3) family protein
VTSPSWTLWARLVDFTVAHSRLILIVLGVLTLFFAFCLFRLEVGTSVDGFKRKEARDLIKVIEDDFDEGTGHALIFESQSERSLLTPDLLHQQFRILQEIKKRYRVTTDSLVEGIEEGLQRTKRKSLLDVTDYKEIAEAILALSGGRTVIDLEKVTRHMLSHPEAVGFYTKFRISAHLSGAGAGASQWEYKIPYVKAIQAYLQIDPGYTQKERGEILASIRDLTDSFAIPELKVYHYGQEIINYDVDFHAQKNALFMALIVIGVDLFLFWGLFRSGREVFLMFFVMIVSCLWTFGIASLLRIPISFLHLIALPILMGTADDDDMIFGRRLAEERAKKNDLPAALRATYAGTGRGIFLTTITTFLAFLVSALTSSAEAIVSFNLLVAFSMLVCLFLTTLLQGSLRVEMARWVGRGGNRFHLTLPQFLKDLLASIYLLITRITKGLSRLSSQWLASHPRRVLFIAGLLFAIALGLGSRLGTEFDPKVFIRRTMPTYEAEKAREKYFGHADGGYILIEGEVENPRLLGKLKLLEEKMASLPDMEVILGRAHVDSVNELIDKRRILITEATPVRAVFDEISGSEETANYVLDETYREAARHLLRKKGDRYDGLLMKLITQTEADGKRVNALRQRIEQEIQRLGFDQIAGIQIRIGGGTISFCLEEIYYFENFVRSFFLSLLLIFLVLLAFWRRFWHSLLAMIPLIVSVSLTAGVMVLAGFKLNALNLTVGSIVVGLGVDYSIHIIERFEEERLRNGSLSPLEAAQKVLSSMGPNILAAALTTIGGFASACVTVMPIAVSFGLLTAVAIFFVYLASIFLLPALLVLFSRYGRRPLPAAVFDSHAESG